MARIGRLERRGHPSTLNACSHSGDDSPNLPNLHLQLLLPHCSRLRFLVTSALVDFFHLSSCFSPTCNIEDRRKPSDADISGISKHAPRVKVNKNCFYFGSGSDSFRRANAAQVCCNVFLVGGSGQRECSSAISARQIVSEKWREGGRLKHLILAATSAFDSTKRRQTSRWPQRADQCSGVA